MILLNPKERHSFTPMGSTNTWWFRAPVLEDRPKYRSMVVALGGRAVSQGELLDEMVRGVSEIVAEPDRTRLTALLKEHKARLDEAAQLWFDNYFAPNPENDAKVAELSREPEEVGQIGAILQAHWPMFNILSATRISAPEKQGIAAARLFLVAFNDTQCGKITDDFIAELPEVELIQFGSHISGLINLDKRRAGHFLSASGRSSDQLTLPGTQTPQGNGHSPATLGTSL